jgi:nitrate/TMAO reductase-like tetraheme cytochrome c subunit
MKYAGTASCISCHKNIYDSFLTTGHYLTSQNADSGIIKGSFETGRNVYRYNPNTFVSMEKKDSGFYEIEHKYGATNTVGRFDVIIGSGIRGQTFLTWKNNNLFQLPVSYLSSIHEWVNSPGADNSILLNRSIKSRCLECHSTYANKIATGANGQEAFARNQMLYGVTCEKCHGPGAKHIEHQTEHPQETAAKFIVNPGTFTRQQSLSLCRLCHGGRMNPFKPAFSFSSGNKIQDYFIINNMVNNARIDVHGNQYGLLSKSECFKNSATLTCVSCHNTHNNERGNVSLFSQRCMTCHNQEHNTFCKINPKLIGPKSTAFLSANCIDCHMPDQASKVITMQTADSTEMKAALLRNHYITIYPDATKEYLANNLHVIKK